MTIAASVTGCYESLVPLDSAPQTDIDARVIGGWKRMFAEPDANRVFAMEVKPSGNRQYQATTMVAGGDLGRYQLYASTLKGEPLVNVRSLQAEPGEKPWVFLRYEFLKPNVLHVRAIREAALEGTQDSAAAMRKSLEQSKDDSEIFEDAFVCLRLK
ncbi:MAG: hypothetical protein ACRD2N_17070 [Vicinamibacterales bacterium]